MIENWIRSALPLLVGGLAMGGVACSGEHDSLGEKTKALTLADGAVIDATAEEVGDGWVSSDGGALDTGSTDAGPMCPGQNGGLINTFLGASDYLEVDYNENAQATAVGANANLVTGLDPATSPGSASFQLPAAVTSSTPNFIDWQNLSGKFAQHRLFDSFPRVKDPSAFPGNSSCVGAANNPPKDEILSAGIANNNDFVYLNVLRASALGDMGYMWLFTKDKPACSVNGRCDNWLRYHIQSGDVLVFGHFRTDGAKLLRVFTAKSGTDTTIDAQEAINCDNTIWQEDTSNANLVAVNTDFTKAGAWGRNADLSADIDLASPKVGADGTLAFDDHVFAEAAVRTSTFGTNGVCGQTFWASVISKSSGNSCDTADVKDLIGPRQVNFGSVAVQAHVKANCNGTVDLQATVKGTSGTVSCKWYDGDPTVESNKFFESPTCDAIVGVPLPEGTHSISVKASEGVDGGSGCVSTSTPVSIQTHPAPTVTCSLTPTCTATNNLSYSATATGQGTLSYAWTLTNNGASISVSPSAPSGASGTRTVSPVGAAIEYTASVEVTDGRACKATCQPVKATPLAPISAQLQNPLPTDRMCVSPYASFVDDVTFAATSVQGGDGAYSFTWSVQNCTDPANASTCSASSCSSNPTTSQCKIDPTDSDTCVFKKIGVTVDDGSTLCSSVTLGPRTYHKTTKIDVE